MRASPCRRGRGGSTSRACTSPSTFWKRIRFAGGPSRSSSTSCTAEARRAPLASAPTSSRCCRRCCASCRRPRPHRSTISDTGVTGLPARRAPWPRRLLGFLLRSAGILCKTALVFVCLAVLLSLVATKAVSRAAVEAMEEEEGETPSSVSRASTRWAAPGAPGRRSSCSGPANKTRT